jgi:hypothetical protein
MEEQELSWKKKSPNDKNEFFDKINELVQSALLKEINDVNSKIDMLFNMGIIKDDEKIKELKEKMKNLNQKA